MALETFSANDVIYMVSPEPELPDGLKTWAVIKALLVDEITGQPPLGDISIQSSFSGMSPRVAPGGMVGFAGIPVRVFPSLQAVSYTVPISIESDGYVSISRNVTVAAIPTFPDTFAPTDLGTLNLHRLPVTIAGRVALNTGLTSQPIVGATISLTGLWRTPPPSTMVVPPDPPNLISLVPEMYFDRATVGTQVQGLNFAGAPGPDKQLLQDAAAGQALMRLSDRKLINVGDILAIDAQDPARTEYITIQSVAGASTDDQPATITLDSPLRSVHRQGAIVHKIQFANVGAVTQLTQDAIAGDVCLFLNSVVALGGAPFVSLQTAGIPTEYHATGYFSAVSDAQGFFRWPLLSRVAQIAMHSHDGVHTDLDVNYSPDYSQEVSRIDFVYQ